MAYGEELPDKCPPDDAQDVALEGVFRIVDALPVTVEDFKSHAAKGIRMSLTADNCRWASCSLVRDAVGHIQKWPKYRGKKCYAVKLSIPAGSGRSFSKKHSNHIDFWRYANFDMTKAVIDTFEMEGAQNG